MNFVKKYDTYDKNADIQKKVAENLLKFGKLNIKDRKIKNVLEVGCGTGIFTRLFLNDFEVENMILNDIFDTEKYLEDIRYDDFICGDMDNINFPHVDFIVSSSTFQWSKDFENLIKKISKNCNKILFSIYIKENLLEIKNHFDISLNYMEMEDIKNILLKYFNVVKMEDEKFEKEFSSPIEALRHLKNTGVTGFKKTNIEKIRSFPHRKLTYVVGYFFCEK